MVRFQNSKPISIQVLPIKQDIALATSDINLVLSSNIEAGLKPIVYERIAVKKGNVPDARLTAKVYTVAEMRAYAQSWGLRPAGRKQDLVDQLRAEYQRRYPVD